MIKFIAILFLLYFLFQSVGHIIRLFFGISRGKQNPNQRPFFSQKNKKSRADLHIDYIPNHKKKKEHFTGGDYVDYQEVDK